MEEVVLGNDHCPECSRLLDRATGAYEKVMPRPNDISICVGCCTYLKFGSDMSLELLTKEEFSLLDRETQFLLHNARQALVEVKKKAKDEEKL